MLFTIWHQEDLGSQGFLNNSLNKSPKTISILLKIHGILQCYGMHGLHNNIKTNPHKVGEDIVMETSHLDQLNYQLSQWQIQLTKWTNQHTMWKKQHTFQHTLPLNDAHLRYGKVWHKSSPPNIEETTEEGE